MRRMYFKRLFFVVIFLILFIGGFVFNPNKAFLYTGMPTHYNLTEQMIKFYNLNYDPDITSHQLEMILRGSLDEDTPPRYVFHLYDPVYNRAPYGVHTAKEWALDSNIQKWSLVTFASVIYKLLNSDFQYHGDYSWPAAIKFYGKGSLDQAYYGLGHILHLIEDMTVPAHSRNDPHLPGNEDPYENWTGSIVNSENYNWADPLYKEGIEPVDLYGPDQVFNELAQYSNQYFFSRDTILSSDYIQPRIIDEKQEDYGQTYQRIYAWGKDENGNLFKLARIQPNLAKNLKEYFLDENDPKLNTDYWNHLAPKAVMYGAGMIKLFLEENGVAVTSDYVAENPILRFPVAKDMVPPAPPVEIAQETTQPGEVKGESTEKNQGEDKDGSIVVIGQKTGGDQGMSWQEVQQINQPASTPASVSEEPPIGGEEEPEPLPPLEIPPHLIINEIQIKDNEFIELYNPTSASIDLASYSFCYYSSAREWNDPYRNKQFPETASISAGGYYLIGFKGYPQENGNPDADWQIYDSTQLGNEAGSVAIFLWDPTTKTASEAEIGVIDAVAWGEISNVSEGVSFQQILGQDKSMQRKEFQDSNDNNLDFEFKKIPTPINSNGEQRKPGTIIYDHTLISEDTLWTIANSPYYLEMNPGEWPRVLEGVTLTIEPGVIVMPMGGSIIFFEIRGTLIAEGTEDEKIVFTSINDADYGGVGSASAGDWAHMVITSTSINTSFKNVIFRYGGSYFHPPWIYPMMVKVDGSSIKMENVTMENSFDVGLYLKNSTSEIKNSVFRDSGMGIMVEGESNLSIIDGCTFENNSEFGLWIWGGASPTISNNQFIHNGTIISQGPIIVYSAYPEFINNQVMNNVINGILIHWQSRFEKDIVWKPGLPYVPITAPIIASGSTLTLEPGVVIKPYSGPESPALIIEGTLIAQAASGSEIVITSLKDDNFGGDTNNDGNATTPANGDWSHLEFSTSSQGSVLDHVFIYYYATSPIVLKGSAEVEIKDTVDFNP